jgi:hypothetical protein
MALSTLTNGVIFVTAVWIGVDPSAMTRSPMQAQSGGASIANIPSEKS